MGGAESTAAPTLNDLPADDQRSLMRSVEMLASRDQSVPGRFDASAFREVHSSMPAALAEALWRALCTSAQAPEAATLDLNAVVRTIVPLRTSDGSAAAARLHLDACFPGDRSRAVQVAFDEAVPWLESMGQALPAGTKSAARAPAAAEKLLAAAACAAWLLDLRELQPLPELTEGASRLLTTAHVRVLSAQLPTEQRRRWRLLFSSSRDGTSFTRFAALGAQRAPCLVVVREAGGASAIFGGFSSVPLRVSPQFGGGYGSFVFRLSPGAPAIHKASGANASLVYLNVGMDVLPNGLAFGANGRLDDRFFGLWLKDDLESGRSDAPCATYGDAPCLASSAAFAVDEVELWAVDDDPPPPSEEEQAAARGENALTSAGVLGSQHEETRKFLEVATGKGKAAADLGVLPDA